MAVGRTLLCASCVGLGWIVWRRRRARAHERTPHNKTRVIPRGHPLVSSSPDEISVVSYNILADAYSESSKLHHIHPQHLTWEHRRPLLEAELSALQADFLCLQEVDLARWDDIVAFHGLAGYNNMLQDRQKEHVIVNAMFYKPRFELLWSEHRTRAMMAAFKYQDSYSLDQVVFIVNVHLEGSPYRPNDRVNQIRNALQHLQQFQQQAGVDPASSTVIVVGDFNSGRAESVYRYLQRGWLEGGTTEPQLPHVEVTKHTISHPYILRDAYIVPTLDQPLPFTRKVPGLASTLDFVMVSPDLEVVAAYWPVDSAHRALLEHSCLPNQLYPSDHLPIGAVLRLRQPSLALQLLYDAQTAPQEGPAT